MRQELKRFAGILTSVVIGIMIGVHSASADIVFRPGPGLNDGSDNGSANAGKDTWTYGAGTASGADPIIYGFPDSTCNSADGKAYIQFELTTLPEDVERVYLGVNHSPHTNYCYSNCNTDFYFYPVTAEWNEMTLSYGSMPTEGAPVYGPLNISFPNDFGNREYDITDIYQAWKSGTVPNHGLAIYSPTQECNNASVGFYVQSSDNAEENLRPYLRIVAPCAMTPPGLLSWWPGDSHPFDLTGGYNGTMVNGATFALGMVGQAFSFDGGNDYVIVPNTARIDGGAEATYSAWVYPAAAPAAETYFGLFGAGDSTLPHWTPQQCRVLYWNKDGSPAGTAKFYMDCGTDDADSAVGRFSASDYPVGSWHLVTGVFNNGSLDIYVNGVLDNGAAMAWNSGTVINTNANNYVWIGGLVRSDQTLTSSHFNGQIDEVQIFGRALTSPEIAATYAAGDGGCCKPLPQAGLISWWRGENSVNDIVSGYNGTWAGTPAYGAGHSDQAFNLNGTSNYIVMPEAVTQGVSSFTIGGWIKPATGGFWDPLFEWSDGGTEFGTHLWVEDNGGNLRLFVNYIGAIDIDDSPLDATVATNALDWNHVALTLDGSTGKARLYCNGREVAQRDGAASHLGFPLRVGSRIQDDFLFEGAVDEIVFYDRALLPAEVEQLFNAVPDTTPDQFTFTDQSGVALDTLTESNQIEVTGIDQGTTISITGEGQYQINNDGWTAGSGFVSKGDLVKIRIRSSVSYATAISAILNIGGVSDTFTVTTLADTVKPVVNEFTISATETTLMAVAVNAFTATDNSGIVSGYMVTDSATPPSPTDAGWSASAFPMTVTLNMAGSKTLYSWAKDPAGNVSEPQTDTVTLKPVRRGTSSYNYYDSISTACSIASGGETISALAVTVPGSVTITGKALNLRGGHSDGYASQPGVTTIQGTLTVGTGSLTVDRVAVR